jgi:cytochrome c peroxidase
VFRSLQRTLICPASRRLLRCALGIFALTYSVATFVESAQSTRDPITALPPPPALDPARVDLGGRLFNDTLLSSKNMLACTSCHNLTTGGTVRLRRTVGYNGRMHRFNAPTIFNVGNNYRLGWRGDFTSLESQNEKVLTDENLMDATWPSLLAKLRANAVYASLFQQAYGKPVDAASVLNALATFQRSLMTPNAPFDRFLAGDPSALSIDAQNGYALFRNYGCASCHQGSNIGGNMFQKFGIFASPFPDGDPVNDGDLGRFTITGADRDIGVFRVPSLRNVAVTAPYFHDGRTDDLAEAVRIMARSQLGRELSPGDVEALVAFLNSLTGEYNGRSLQ